MRTFFTHADFVARYGERFCDVCERYATHFEWLTLTAESDRLAPESLASIDLACFIGIWEPEPEVAASA